MPKLAEVQPNQTPPEPADSPNGAQSIPAAKSEESRYFVLSKPIEVGGRVKKTFDRLLVDSTELGGDVYFELIDRYSAEYPRAAQINFTEMRDKRFLAMVICKLNPPMIEEDLKKVSFIDLGLLFLRAQGSIFSR